MSGGSLKDTKLCEKISDFFSKYIDSFQSKLKDKNLAIGMFSFGKPTNYYFFVEVVQQLYT